eukprot:746217-Hanusia_phi.AAC.3
MREEVGGVDLTLRAGEPVPAALLFHQQPLHAVSRSRLDLGDALRRPEEPERVNGSMLGERQRQRLLTARHEVDDACWSSATRAAQDSHTGGKVGGVEDLIQVGC